MLTERDVRLRSDALRRGADAAGAGRPAAVAIAAAAAGQPATRRPAFLLFTSGTEGPPKGALHPRRYVAANRLQTERWMGVRPGRPGLVHGRGRLVEVASQRLAGGRAGRRRDGDPRRPVRCRRAAGADRAARAQRAVHVADRVPALRPASRVRRAATGAVREAVAAGEALDAPPSSAWREAYGIAVRDGYGQTETGAVTGVLAGDAAGAGRWAARCPGSRCGSRTASCAWRRPAADALRRLLERPRRDRGAAARRLVAHRRPGPARGGRVCSGTRGGATT